MLRCALGIIVNISYSNHMMKGRHLPEQYRFCRLSTRSELRDYMVNSIYSEIKGLS